MTSYIEECYANGVNKINVITGKGLRSKNLNDPYQSNNLSSILKFSVPHFIKGNNQLMSKIISIDFEAVENPSVGNFDIFLRKKNKNYKINFERSASLTKFTNIFLNIF